ncbi:hypothetical protein [Dactylosporangium cerinum]
MTRADLRVGVTDDGLIGPRSQQPKRRTFAAEYKLAMVAEYDAASEPGAKGALLASRRAVLLPHHRVAAARDAGALGAVADKPRKPTRSQADREAERLRAENERVRADLAKTRAALDVVGKAHALLA